MFTVHMHPDIEDDDAEDNEEINAPYAGAGTGLHEEEVPSPATADPSPAHHPTDLVDSDDDDIMPATSGIEDCRL